MKCFGEQDFLNLKISDRARVDIGLRLLRILAEIYYKTPQKDRKEYIWLYNQKIEPFLACLQGEEFEKYGRPLRFPFLFGSRMFDVFAEEIIDGTSITFIKKPKGFPRIIQGGPKQ